MPDPMTDTDLEAIRARAEAATPGPWQYDGMHNEIQTPYGKGWWLIISECRSAPDQPLESDEFGHHFDGNFAFIAHARDDIPALVAEVRRLRALVEAGYREGYDEGSGDGQTDTIDVDERWRWSDARTALPPDTDAPA